MCVFLLLGTMGYPGTLFVLGQPKGRSTFWGSKFYQRHSYMSAVRFEEFYPNRALNLKEESLERSKASTAPSHLGPLTGLVLRPNRPVVERSNRTPGPRVQSRPQVTGWWPVARCLAVPQAQCRKLMTQSPPQSIPETCSPTHRQQLP